MVGNAVFRYLKLNPDFIVSGTARTTAESDLAESSKNKYVFFDVADYDSIERILQDTKPDWVINCIADTRVKTDNIQHYFFINSVFPQLLSQYSKVHKFRLIHLSTNGVFSAEQSAPYIDSAESDARDIYGISKLLSENVTGITLRTSFIGHSISGKEGLIDWFLTSKGTVQGYSHVLWNGITTLTAAKIIEEIIIRDLRTNGTPLQIVSETLSKYDLMNLIQEIYGTSLQIDNNSTKDGGIYLAESDAQKIYFKDIMQPLVEQLKELKEFYGK